MISGTGGVSTYRLGSGHVLRALGPLAIILGVLWAVLALAGPPSWVRTVLAVLTLTVLVASAYLAVRPPRVLALTDDGFRVSLVRGTGERFASWKQVHAVNTQQVGRALSLVITLDNGRTSVVPLSMLGPRDAEARRDVHERLNAANGYRPIDPA